MKMLVLWSAKLMFLILFFVESKALAISCKYLSQLEKPRTSSNLEIFKTRQLLIQSQTRRNPRNLTEWRERIKAALVDFYISESLIRGALVIKEDIEIKFKGDFQIKDKGVIKDSFQVYQVTQKHQPDLPSIEIHYFPQSDRMELARPAEISLSFLWTIKTNMDESLTGIIDLNSLMLKKLAETTTSYLRHYLSLKLGSFTRPAEPPPPVYPVEPFYLVNTSPTGVLFRNESLEPLQKKMQWLSVQSFQKNNQKITLLLKLDVVSQEISKNGDSTTWQAEVSLQDISENLNTLYDSKGKLKLKEATQFREKLIQNSLGPGNWTLLNPN